MQKKITILIVGNHPFTLEQIEAILNNDYQTITAVNGLDALELAQSESVDLILIDVEKPDMDGYETCRQLKRSKGTALIPVIIISTHCQLEERLKGYEAGANDYIAKSFDANELKAKILRLLEMMHHIRSAELMAKNSLLALENMSSGILFINRLCEVIFANRSALRMLGEKRGLSLHKLTNTSSLGRLVADNRIANKSINNALNASLQQDPATAEHFPKSVSMLQISGLASYKLQFSRVENKHVFNSDGNELSTIIFITDGHPKLAPETLKYTFGLTNTEAQVAIALVEFSTVKSVSYALGMGVSTVRFHVKKIYSKLGVNTQIDFTKLMLRLA